MKGSKCGNYRVVLPVTTWTYSPTQVSLQDKIEAESPWLQHEVLGIENLTYEDIKQY